MLSINPVDPTQIAPAVRTGPSMRKLIGNWVSMRFDIDSHHPACTAYHNAAVVSAPPTRRLVTVVAIIG
jgi:hypothetical protein